MLKIILSDSQDLKNWDLTTGRILTETLKSVVQKVLLSLCMNGMDIVSIVNQDNNNKGNHMMGQCVIVDLTVYDIYKKMFLR